MIKNQQNHFSRRRFLASVSLAATAVGFMPHQLSAEEGNVVDLMRNSAAAAKLTLVSVRKNISVIIGSGGNIGVLAGADGKLLVDAGLVGSRPQITEALAKVSADPVTRLVNTHWHFDHTDGNAWLRDEGAEILAHEGTRRRMQVVNRVEPLGHTFPPAPRRALPTSVFKDEHTLFIDDDEIRLHYCGPAHTDTDVAVHFVSADVLHLGDTYFNNYYPLIDYSSGGNINGLIAVTERHLSWCTARTAVIPGHGAVGNRATLSAYRDMLVTCRDRILRLKQEGRTEGEIVAAKPTAEYDAEYGAFLIKPEIFTKLIYASV
jgi:glyoxylase-like metal-dependent hydrolase (beta-lactamase superfamily II)